MPDRDLEKKVDNFAKKTLNEIEIESKMLSTTIGQITDVAGLREQY